MTMRSAVLLVLMTGCISELNQAAGTGALYYTRCSADMLPTEAGYKAQCEPEQCLAGFTTGPVGHVVVALDPGRKVVGYAERICLQDLARASGLFNPALVPPADPAAAGESKGDAAKAATEPAPAPSPAPSGNP
jgi:hypothetical protein